MRRKNSDYEKMARLAIDVYLDYDIKSFPVDAYKQAELMGFEVSHYSDYPVEVQKILIKRSEEGFNIPVPEDRMHTKKIIINDNVESEARKQSTIFHEIKHIINYDIDESPYNEDMADFFARYMRCPTPFLIYARIEESEKIQKMFGLSKQMARISANNVRQRVNTYGYAIFDYEVPLLKQLLGDSYNEYIVEVIYTNEK